VASSKVAQVQAGSGADVIWVSSWDGRGPLDTAGRRVAVDVRACAERGRAVVTQAWGLCDAAAPIGRPSRQFQDWMELASTVVPAMTSTRIV
jgi:hypothetical protein